MLLNEMYDIYISHLKIYNAHGYVVFTEELHKKIISYFGNVEHDSITYQSIIDYILFLQKNNMSNNTINKHISYLKRLYYFNEYDCKFARIKKLKEKFITFGCVEENFIELLPKILKSQSLKNQLIIMLFYDTGIRVNELINIELKNVDNENRRIYLEYTKTSKPRYIYYSKTTQKIMYTFCKNADRKYLFTMQKSDNKMGRDTIEAIFKRIKKKFNLSKFSPHRLRHSLSTELYKNGADLLLISGILGHSNVNTTKRYIHSDHNLILKNYDKYHK